MDGWKPGATMLGVFIIAVIAFVIVAKAGRWWVKLIAFLFALGSVNTILSMLEANADWSLAFNAAILVYTGIVSWSKATGNRVMAIAFVLLGLLVGWSALESFGLSPEDGGSAVTRVLVVGVETLTNLLQQVSGTF